MSGEPSDDEARAGRTAFARAYDALGHVGGLILAVMTAAVFLQVVLRFLGSASIDGLDEVPRFLFVWLVMIGAASAMQRGQHTVLDYFVNLLGPRGRALVLILANAVGIALFLYLIKLSLVLVPNAQLQTSAGLGPSARLGLRGGPGRLGAHHLAHAAPDLVALRSLWPKRS